MKVREFEEFLKTVTDKNKELYFYYNNDDPFNDSIGISNAFEVSRDAMEEGNVEGVYLKGI